jgi:DNA-binding CsgD family transcriptional regulator
MHLASAFAARGDLKDAADLAEAIAARQPDPDAALVLAARSLIRIGDGERVQRVSRGLSQKLAWVEASAYWCLHDTTRAITLLERAVAEKRAGPDDIYALVIFLWSERKLDDAESLVLPALERADAHATSRLEQMLGWIELSREKYVLAGHHFKRALAYYERAGRRDEWFRGRLLQTLSTIAVETIDLDLQPQLSVTMPFDIGKEARAPWFYIMHNRGWLALLAGRQLDGAEAFSISRVLATSKATAALAEVTQANFFRLTACPSAAQSRLQLARRLVGKQQWTSANADERMALLEYVLEAAASDPRSASANLARYISGRKRRSPDLVLENDRRVVALELMAHGAVDAIEGRRASALRALEGALNHWTQLGFRYREALTLLRLHDINGNPRYLERALQAAASAPQSWLSADIVERKRRTGNGLANLSHAERRVMFAICEGKTSREIAREFNRSVHTIRNQTLKVYASMGVRSRAALLIEFARLRLAPKTKP